MWIVRTHGANSSSERSEYFSSSRLRNRSSWTTRAARSGWPSGVNRSLLARAMQGRHRRPRCTRRRWGRPVDQAPDSRGRSRAPPTTARRIDRRRQPPDDGELTVALVERGRVWIRSRCPDATSIREHCTWAGGPPTRRSTTSRSKDFPCVGQLARVEPAAVPAPAVPRTSRGRGRARRADGRRRRVRRRRRGRSATKSSANRRTSIGEARLPGCGADTRRACARRWPRTPPDRSVPSSA